MESTSRRLRRLLCCLLPTLLPAIACVEVENIELGDRTGLFTLDPGKLRPDYQALGSQPPSGARATWSDGNVYDARGNRSVAGGAPLSPLRIADIEGPLNDQLRRAACLWIDRGNESARVSFEMIAHDVDMPEDNGVIAELSGCGGVAIDPTSRGQISYQNMDTNEMIEVVGEVAEFYDVEMTIHTGPAGSDPYNACDAGDPRIASRPMRVVSLNGLREEPIFFPSYLDSPRTYPFCMNQGSLPRVDEDWTMQLDMIQRSTGSALSMSGANAPPFVLPTRLKVVEPSTQSSEFLISRPLRYLGAREGRVDGDRTITPYGFTWRAPILGDGRWQENFSPNLAISRIRVFRDLGPDPDTGELIREYLTPVAIDAYSDPGLLRGDREVRCDFEPGNGEEPAACLDAVGFTPTYRIDRDGVGTRLTDLLTWVVEWNEVVECQPYQRPDGTVDCTDVVVETPPVDERDRDLYVEFHLVRPSHSTSGQGLMVRPPASDFGDVQADRQPLFEDVFSLHNVGQGAIRLTDVRLEGADAADYEIVPDPSTLVGTRVGMGDTLDLDVRFVSTNRHQGRREATLRVSAEDVQGRPMTVRAHLRATVVDWIFEAVHSPFLFLRHTTQHPWDDTRQWQKPLLVLNLGAFDMPRQQITITGPGAAHWSILRERSEYLPPADYVPWINGEAPPREHVVESGGAEILYVVYHPDVPYLRGVHHAPDEAEIRIQVEDGEYRIPLVGYCVEQCRFQAPTPYAPPSGGGGVKVVPGTNLPALGSGGLIEVESRLAP